MQHAARRQQFDLTCSRQAAFPLNLAKTSVGVTSTNADGHSYLDIKTSDIQNHTVICINLFICDLTFWKTLSRVIFWAVCAMVES